MLRKLLSYSAIGFVVQLTTGLLTKIVEMFIVAEVLTREELGDYRHFILILEVCSGFFVVGIDHSLVTFINATKENYGRFLRLFSLYGLVISTIFVVVALGFSGTISAATFLGLVTVGPFVFLELGKVVFRSRLEKRQEFGFLMFQSLAWSLGVAVALPIFGHRLVPIWCTLLGVLPGAVLMAVIFWRRAREEQGRGITLSPFAAEYSPLWRSWWPLWIAGVAFLANTHVVNLLVDLSYRRLDPRVSHAR